MNIPENFIFKSTARGMVPVFTLANIAPMIEDHYDCSYNLWSNEKYINGKPVTDDSIAQIKFDIEKSFSRFHVTASQELVSTAVSYVCQRHSFDPLKDRLKAAEKLWHDEGEPDNLLHMFQDYLGCEDSVFTENVTKIFTFGLIGRAFEPGMKFDTFIVFSGEQSQDKSTLFSKLGGAFFNDTLDFSMLGTELALEQLYRGIWLADIQNMRRVTKSDVNVVNAFITTQVDTYRPKYTRKVESIPRRMVMVGTTNDKSDLFIAKDNRRFIVLECDAEKRTKSALDMTEEEVELLLGEMVALYRTGIDYKALSDEITGNKEYRFKLMSELETFLRMPRPADWNAMDKASRYNHYKAYRSSNRSNEGPMVKSISTNEIWSEMLGGPEHQMDLKTARLIAKDLQRLGYSNQIQTTLPGYGRVRRYHLTKR